MSTDSTSDHPEIQAPRRLKFFPYDFDSRREILFYPEKVESIVADLLEIGPGRGDYLLAQAAAYPARRFAAIEIGKKRYLKLIRRVEARNLGNILLIYGDARLVIPKYGRTGTLQRIEVFFPDPWPKRRHAFHRLLAAEFLGELARCLAPEGMICLKTDVRSYADWVVGNVVSSSNLVLADMSVADSSDTEAAPSLYEQKQREAGYEIFTLTVRRAPSAPPAL